MIKKVEAETIDLTKVHPNDREIIERAIKRRQEQPAVRAGLVREEPDRGTGRLYPDLDRRKKGSTWYK